MSQSCPRCAATVGDDLTRCPECGGDLDPCRTIPPARPRPGAALKPPPPLEPTPRPERPDRPPAARKPKPRPSAPKVAAPPPSPSALPPPVAPPSTGAFAPPVAGALPGHATSEMNYAGAPPQAGGLPPNQGAPSGVRGWMIKMLGGAAPQPSPVPPAPAPPYYGYPPPPPGTPYPPPGGYPPAGSWPPQPPPPQTGHPSPYAAPPGPAPGFAPEPARPLTPQPFVPGAEDDEEGKTRFIGGVNIDRLKIPKYTFTLQILDHQGQWRDWGPIHANGLNVGRAKNSADFPGLGSMAVRHMKFRYERNGLVVEDLGSLNGVYVRITQPVELIDGMRFRVGGQAIEFHQAEPFDPVPPTTSEEGEEFCSRDLEPLAYLDMIRPNGRPGLRFPITRTDPTILGREGPNTHVALANDFSVSGMHARVVRDQDGKFFLEDLKSRNGTFVHVLGSRPVGAGDVVLAGQVLFRIVDHGGG